MVCVLLERDGEQLVAWLNHQSNHSLLDSWAAAGWQTKQAVEMQHPFPGVIREVCYFGSHPADKRSFRP